MLDVELSRFGFQFPGVLGRIVVAEAFGYDHASSPINQRESVIAAWAHDDQRCQWRRLNTGLLVELGSGLACAFAQPFKNCAALGERYMHGRSSTGLRLFVSTQASRCLPMGAQWSADG